MINLFQSQKLSFKKISFHKGKSLFVIVPIAILFGALVFAASEAKNLITVAHDSIFSPIQGQNEIIEVTKNSGNQRMLAILDSSSDTGYTTTDTSNIEAIDNVEKANLVTTLPINIIKTSDLFAEKSITIDNIAGLDSTYAKLYTNESFSYTEGQPIPIILNANDFVEVYQDWGGKTEVEIKFSTGGTPSGDTQGPVKARAIGYTRDELIGKTFTVQFGGLEELQPYKQTSTTSGFKYTKKTDKELATEVATRKTALSKYWDYTKISTPLTYTFVVAGVSEGTDKTTAYIPADFASKLMQEYLTLAISSRNKTAMPSSDYNVTYTGLVYDGVTLQEDATTTLFAGIRNSVTDQVKSQFNNVNKEISAQNSKIANTNSQIDRSNRIRNMPPGGFPGGNGGSVTISKIGQIGKLDANDISIKFPTNATSYAVPGLVYKKDRTTSALTGEYKSFDFKNALPLTSETVLVKLSSVGVREQVVKSLNEKGYNYQDYSKYKQFETLEQYIYLILNIASAVFVVITGLFVLINMAKFVSESRKEIGIFRAIGATKADIRKMFMQQSLLYIVTSIALGTVIGVVSVVAAASIMVSSAQQFMNSTLGTNIVLTNTISRQHFLGFDIPMIGLYVAGLVLITLVVSLIPAGQAAKVSPVEAIRNS